MTGIHMRVQDGLQSARVPLREPGEEGLLIGRDARCDLRLHDSAVARRHALLTSDDSGWVVENISRGRELLVGGRPVRRARLEEPHRFELGGASAELHLGEACDCDDRGARGQSSPPARGRRTSGGAHSRTLASAAALLSHFATDLQEARQDWQLVAELERFLCAELGLAWAVAHVRDRPDADDWSWLCSFLGEGAPGRRLPRPRPEDVATALQTGRPTPSRPSLLALPLRSHSGRSGDIVVTVPAGREGLPEELLALVATTLDMTRAVRAHLDRSRAIERRALEAERAAREAAWSVQVFQSGPASQQILERAKQAGASGLPLVLVGESGTGKKLLAATIHHASPRAAHPFRRLDCSVSNPTDNPPAADPAVVDGAAGTLYLDKLHAMSIAAQAQLAEALPPPSATRATIAATETHPARLVQQGLLIDRLARRLGDIVLTLPPLRERRDEIAPIAQHLLGLIAPHRPLRLASSTVPLLVAYDWPGNLRELKVVLERAASDLHGNLIRPRDLPPHVRGEAPEPREQASFPTLAEVERRHIQAALEAHHGCISSAARDLGISRPRLYRLIDRLGLGG